MKVVKLGILCDKFWGNYYFRLQQHGPEPVVATEWEFCRNGTTGGMMRIGDRFWVRLDDAGKVDMVSWRPIIDARLR